MIILWSFASENLFNNGKILHRSTLHTSDMKYKYMKSTEVVILSLLGFVASESKSNYPIFSTSVIKKRLFRDISFWSLLLKFEKEEPGQDVSPQISGSQKVVAGKDRGDFLQGGCSFYIKNKPKSEICNNKKCFFLSQLRI